MVGSHTLLGKNSKVDINQMNFLKHEPWFKVDQIEVSENISMFISYYDGYPFIILKNDNWTIVFEGMIYNLSNEEVINKCEHIANKFFNKEDYLDEIKQFAKFCDGDFNVQIFDKKSSRYLIFNDYMGRLPLYYSIGNEIFTISRDIKTNLEFVPRIDLDLTGITEFLMLSYPLGDKTYFKNIHRLEPFQAIIIEDLAKINTHKVLNTCTFPYTTKSVKTTKDEILLKLCNQFSIDTKNRINKLRESGYEIISDLSGGFDSRAIIGMLSKFDKNIKYFTYEYIQDESTQAQQIFNTLGKPGVYTKLKFNNGLKSDSISNLIYKTNASVDYLTTSICYNDAASIEGISELRKKTAHFGGFAGEFIRHPVKHFFKSVYFGLNNRFYNAITIEDTISIFKSNSFIQDEIKHYYKTFIKEKKEIQLRKFYFDYTRAVLSGEERSRLFRWTVHPMWSQNWIRTIHEYIPLKWTGYKFFIEFMKKIDGKLLSVPIYKRDELDMTSQKSINDYVKKIETRSRIRTKINHILKYYLPALANIYGRLIDKVSVSTDQNESVYNTFLKYYNELDKLKSIFNLEKVRDNIWSFGREYNRLVTLAIYFSQIEKRHSDKIQKIKH